MSGRLDLDLLRGLLCLRGFGQPHLEDAVLERRGDLIGVDALGQAEIALERAVATLGDVVVLLLFVGLFFLFALDGDSAVGDAYLDVLFVHSWHFRRDLVGLVVSETSTAGAEMATLFGQPLSSAASYRNGRRQKSSPKSSNR